MIVTPYKCVNFNAENFKTNLNQTCKLKGRYEIGCKFNQKTLDKRKEKLENFYNNCNEYYG